MKDVKMPTSRSYQTFLIESLKNPKEAAGYIEIILEEGSDEPSLLRNALHNVVEAHATMNKLSESAKQHHKKLDTILTQSGGSEIYTFIELVDKLGFQVAVSEAMP
ncbi:MAG TPA: transcriptional regulator [Cyanobacteria bacterium UBA8543]|nr:transcriptional regulator [Cyanobacteria bacterium UBA8543]